MGALFRALTVVVSIVAPPIQDLPQPAQPVLQEFRLDGATIFSRDDALWLLKLREGSPLTETPSDVAKAFEDQYKRDGYSEARVTAAFGEGRLTLTVDEGRIDEVEIVGVSRTQADRMRRRLGIKPGDLYNSRTIGQETARLEAESHGAIEIGQPRRSQPTGDRTETIPDKVILEHRGSRSVLVVPIRWKRPHTDATFGSSREDLYSPVDQLAPSIGFHTTIFDHDAYNHTFVSANLGYKFGPDTVGYSFGVERPIFSGPRLFVGGELHDITATDDLWRLATVEQTVAALGFKNSFRDYYRRRGAQLFGVFRAGENNEFSLMTRWDRHSPLPNTTNYSFFRDSAVFRPNPLVADEHVNAFVIGYTFDTRPLSWAGTAATYDRHLKDSLFGYGVRNQPGLRLEWTSEIAGHALHGDARFDRHILNARGYLPIGSRTQISARGLFGWGNGTLPLERQFAIGGIGTVHGYSFKEASGTGLTLINAEYRVNLTSDVALNKNPLNVFVFYDAGRTTSLFNTTPTPWLSGTGFGFGFGDIRLEFGYRTNAIPKSLQVLVRVSPTF
jgi:outer membrane protein assembly factor BamA